MTIDQSPPLPPAPPAAIAPLPGNPLHVIPAGVQIHEFRGGAATWFGTQILGVLVTVFTLGICYPFAVVLVERWRAKNTYLYGRQLAFIGTGWGIFGLWVKWLLLIVITLGIYSFWVYPRMTKWQLEKTVFA
ncbi:DUF898 domain-containing protein [Specibacter cremeus]|uniref:DUF898 domain-containing protein n=1 Tax=Specibacter cremeus TaxID=1629051 RepID=UPI001F0C3185|nr:DUF898 domain-containing protein [Specibacter cremeus]